MRTPFLTALFAAIVALGTVQAAAYNPCDPKYDTCK